MPREEQGEQQHDNRPLSGREQAGKLRRPGPPPRGVRHARAPPRRARRRPAAGSKARQAPASASGTAPPRPRRPRRGCRTWRPAGAGRCVSLAKKGGSRGLRAVVAGPARGADGRAPGRRTSSGSGSAVRRARRSARLRPAGSESRCSGTLTSMPWRKLPYRGEDRPPRQAGIELDSRHVLVLEAERVGARRPAPGPSRRPRSSTCRRRNSRTPRSR